MKTPVYIFTPDNDLALAHGGENYVPPAVARTISNDLSCLAAWLPQGTGIVSVADVAHAEWLRAQSVRWGLGVEVVTHRQVGTLSGVRYCPWGWSARQRRWLLDNGAREGDLPTAEQIATLRRLSHRRTTITIHRLYHELTGDDTCPVPEECRSVSEVERFVCARGGRGVAKLPWSGSGRGVMSVRGNVGRDFLQWCSGGIKRQGSVLCETFLHSLLDFAVEIECFNGTASVAGLSVFESDAHHQYAHGVIDRPGGLLRRIKSRYAEVEKAIFAVRLVVERLVAPHYDGLLGVDMMLYRDAAGATRLNPCVELNLRPTMGAVSAAIGRVLPSPVENGWHFTVMRNDDLRKIPPENVLRLTPDLPGAQWAAGCIRNV